MNIKNFKKPSSDQIVGGALFVLGIAQMVLSSKKEKTDRQALKNELKTEVLTEVIKELPSKKD